MSQLLSIGELAKESGVKIVTIRYYEQIGILPFPDRTEPITGFTHPGTRSACVSFVADGISVFPWSKSATCFSFLRGMLNPAGKFATLQRDTSNLSRRNCLTSNGSLQSYAGSLLHARAIYP